MLTKTVHQYNMSCSLHSMVGLTQRSMLSAISLMSIIIGPSTPRLSYEMDLKHGIETWSLVFAVNSFILFVVISVIIERRFACYYSVLR